MTHPAEDRQSAAEEAPDSTALARIHAALPSLPPSERRVADAVLSDPGKAAELSITALAERAETSVATVMRFCRAIEITSYPQLRLALAASAAREYALGGGRPVPGTDIGANDTLREITDKIIYSEVRALEDTGAELDVEALGKAVDAVCRARRIDIFGVGASAFVGQDLHQKLHRLGHIVFTWADRHAALTASALLTAEDVVVGISHSGETEDTVEPLQAAAKRGATTIALTNVPDSTLARTADVVLVACARETSLRSGATVSRIAQLALVDCLFVGVAQRSFTATSAALHETHQAVQSRRRPKRKRDAPGAD
ncbi:MurR/RpiR family transcriptional regulator [Streptomyces griseoluteus]|uniref:MurR/RpiR family transcriptional regulator n=1 Tax=Streptomyces TaxID=1883 RepID=UPI000A363B13|nr:MurR/RpiR family transcriptional regulator [Streptomyces recifensis]